MKVISEALRKRKIQTANEWNKKQLAEGKVKRMTLQFSADDAAEIDAIAAELGLSRPATIKRLCELYRGL